MSKTWVKTDYVPETNKDYITEDKWYELSRKETDGENILGGAVVWDDGEEGFLSVSESSHINGKSWTVYEGETPPVDETKEGKSMIGKLSGVDWSKAPDWATHCHPNNRHFYKLNAQGDFLASSDGNGWETHTVRKGWAFNWGMGCISKEDDLMIVPETPIQPKPETEWNITTNTRFKVGDIVKIIDNRSHHEFLIGEQVRIVSIGDDLKAEYLDGHDFWWVFEEDIELVENAYCVQQPEWKIRHIKSDD